MSLKIGFFGSADFLLPFLEALKERHALQFIVTSQDKPKGRGMKLTKPIPKVFGESNNILVFQPLSIKDENFIKKIKSFDCDLFLVIAYGKIIPKELLDHPKFGAINLHFSLLPRWRGAGPINWALINGDIITGLTLMKMDEGLDTGDIIFQKQIPIDEDDNAEDLLAKMVNTGKHFLIDSLQEIEKGNYTLVKQDESKATYARMLKKEDGLIDWSQSAMTIHNKVRGLIPWPCAYGFLDGKRLLILKTKVLEGKDRAGLITGFDGEGLIVGTGDGLLKLLNLKEEGKKALSAKDYYNGRKDIIGKFFTR